MRTTYSILAVILAVSIALSGCATTSPRVGEAMQELDALWSAENVATQRREGQQVVAGTPDQAERATRQALIKLGMTVAPRSQAPTVTGSRLYPKPGYSWTPAIRALEEPRARRILSQSIGPLATIVTSRTSDEILTARVSFAPGGSGRTSVLADFRGDIPNEDCSKGCVRAMPPAAYRQAQAAFWSTFQGEFASVVAADRAKLQTGAASRTRKEEARKPVRKGSGWVLPSSGWKPPPKKK